MILKACFLLMVSVAWEVAGVSISNVYMSTGAGANLEYLKYPSSYNYEYPSSYPSSQIAQYSLAPVSYEPYPVGQSYAYRTYPEQTIALSQAAPSANYVAYGTPSTVPYVYGRNDPATSYSYVLVNEGAGQELKLSDGEVIRGGYPFYQPQGLVQYVADDNQGLNAILKAYIPNEPVALTETVHHATVHHESVHHAEPCYEVKSEALTAHESHEESHEDHLGGHEHHASHEEHDASHESHESHEARHSSHEGHHESHELHESHEARHSSQEGHHESHEEHHDSSEAHHDSHEGHHESHEGHHDGHEIHEARHGSHEEVHEFILHDNGHKDRIIVINEREGDLELESEEHDEPKHEDHGHHESAHESHEHHESEHESYEHHDSGHESLEHHGSEHEGHGHHESEHESNEHESHEHASHEHESHEHASHEHHSEENEEPTHEHHDGHHTHEAIVEASHEPHASHELHEVHVIPQVPTLGLPVPNNVYIPYNDFIKCIEAAMVKGNTHPLYAPVPKPISPLTYLVFNKPC